MEQDFVLPAGHTGRFAIVKLWPEIKTAEDECIARLKISAIALGLECFEIHADGRLLESPDKVIQKKDVDFVSVKYVSPLIENYVNNDKILIYEA